MGRTSICVCGLVVLLAFSACGNGSDEPAEEVAVDTGKVAEEVVETPDVEADLCEPVCGESICGPDGCGGSCGECVEGEECVEGQCVFPPECVDGEACDDGDLCTDDDLCVEESCQGTPKVCDDDIDCTDDSCKDGDCVYKVAAEMCLINAVCYDKDDIHDKKPCRKCIPSVSATEWTSDDTNECEDGDACTAGDYCMDGVCEPGEEDLDCDDKNVCTDESCDPQDGCQYTANSEPCKDDDACTVDEYCSATQCVSGGTVDCDDNNVCTADSCDAQEGCVNAPLAGDCDDGDVCTVGDLCGNGTCQPGNQPLDCDDFDICTDDTCTSGVGCQHPNNTADCNDGNECTVNSICAGGECGGGEIKTCDDNNICTNDTCSPLEPGGCVYIGNDAVCEDGNLCTLGDTCSNGECVAGVGQLFCDDANVCTEDSCVPATGCKHKNIPALCDDLDPCTDGDFCANGVCQAGAEVCQCSTNIDCLEFDDDDLCTGTWYCDKGNMPVTCKLDLNSVVTCDDSGDTECLESQCQPETGQCDDVAINESGNCNDDDGCTNDDVCVAGQCLGTTCEDVGLVCSNGQCVDCAPDCSGKTCGDNGCGGSCGTCGGGAVCCGGSCLVCCDGNDVEWDGCNNGEISQFQVADQTGVGQQWDPNIAIAPNGKFLIVWPCGGNNLQKPNKVYGRLFDADGASLTEPFVIQQAVGMNSKRPSVMYLEQKGAYVVVWYADDGSDPTSTITYRFVSDAGVPLGDEQGIAGNGLDPHTDLAPDGDGFWVLWEEQGPNGGFWDDYVAAKSFTPDGSVLWHKTDFFNGSSGRPRIARLSNGKYVVSKVTKDNAYSSWRIHNAGGGVMNFWYHETDFLYIADLVATDTAGFLALLANADELVPTFYNANQDLIGSTTIPGITYKPYYSSADKLSDGRFVVVTPGTTTLKAHILANGGIYNQGPIAVNTYTGGYNLTPVVRAIPSGGFIVVWKRCNTESNKCAVYVQRFNSAGNKLYH
jgi:hypothetical protein